MTYQKTGDKIKPTATWKQTKQIWILRVARSHLSKIVQGIKVIDNEDTRAVTECLRMLDEVISRQITFTKK